MTLESKNIKEIYAGKVAKKYDSSMPPFFARWKRKAFDESSLKKGDKVLVFCTGTGLDFTHILRRIGPEGKIVGVDFSAEMLKKARERISKNRWKNIELIEADITRFSHKPDRRFDIGVCTLGMSIIPDYKAAYHNLHAYVKLGGEIIIGDMQLAAGWYARFNPLILFLARKYGGTYEGHQNSLDLYAMMKKDLTGVRKREFFFNSYFYCIGKTQ